jgi:peptidyl-prolyl cis-trans isomerase SurA
MVAEFDRWMFALPPGQLSPVIETVFGYHIIRVERVKPAEVKASHILIRWKIDSSQVELARVEADSVLTAWKAGTPFDSLVAHHHDPNEEKGSLQPFPRDSLPPSYTAAFRGKLSGDFVSPFTIEDRGTGKPKFVVAQVITATEGGDYTVADLRDRIREQLADERAIARLLESLRKETYVSLRL